MTPCKCLTSVSGKGWARSAERSERMQVRFIEMKNQPFADILQECTMLDYQETEKKGHSGVF
jgi:hypothetical protein